MGFGGLSIATTGIRVAQRNLNVTGHNIANAEIAGYSRQRIVQATATSRCAGFSAAGNRMFVGMGAHWSEVHQIRNEFLDINFRNNVSQLNFYSKKVEAGVEIQTLLGELQGSYPFQAVLNDIWMSIQELTNTPEGLANRHFFLANANTFITKAQDVFDGLVRYQTNLDLQIREMVNGRNGINATVEAIGELNRLIRLSEGHGDKANDYRDERHRLVDHLATMIPIDVWQGPNGDVNITSLGHHILTGTSQSLMGLRYISNDMPFVEPVFTTSPDILSSGTPPSEFTSYLNYITPLLPELNNDRGGLIALIQARGNAPANHLSADILPPMPPQRIIELAGIVSDAFAVYLPAGSAGDFSERLAEVISIVSAELAAAIAADPSDPAEIARLQTLRENLLDAQSHSERDRNIFIRRLVNTPAGTSAHTDLLIEIDRDFAAQMHNHRAHVWSLEHAMIPQVQMNLDRVVNSVVTMINDALTGNLRGKDGNFLFYQTDDDGNPLLAFDENGLPIINPFNGEQERIPIRPLDGNIPPREGIPLFIRDVDVREREVREREAPGTWTATWPLSQFENPNRVETVFTTTNIRINPEFLLDGGHNNLALSLSGDPGDTRLLNALQNIWVSNEGPYSVTIGDLNFNIQDAYIRLTGQIATETAAAASKVSSQTVKVEQAHNMRMAIKGVSMDEEMSAMLRFQFAFQAASRAFNVIDSMIDRLINGTGRVGL
ncbi:MAG: hypothetical protein FWE27_02540 [Defluviitaleaceae bacterium]|nr:hypothetical protein [Defluviitaleaceae bacterium]